MPPLERATPPALSASRGTAGASAPLWRMYSPGQVLVAALLGQAVAGCWLMAENFKRLGERGRGTKVFVVGLVVSMAVIGLAWTLPHDVARAVAVATAVPCFQYARGAQGRAVVAHVAAGGRRESWLKVVGVGVVAAFVVVSSGAGVAAIANLFGNRSPG